MITRTRLEELVHRCENEFRSRGRKLTASLNPGASDDALIEAEATLGFRLPHTLRCFLAETNGLELASKADPDHFTECLWIPDVQLLVTGSGRLHESLCDQYKNAENTQKPPFYLWCGGPLDTQVMLRAPEPGAEGADPVALEYTSWRLDMKWQQIASSFEDWLLRSFSSIKPSGSFTYFLRTN